MNRTKPYSDLAKTHEFGLVINDLENIGTNLNRLVHPEKSQRAQKFYLEYLNFELYRDIIWSELQNTANTN